MTIQSNQKKLKIKNNVNDKKKLQGFAEIQFEFDHKDCCESG